MKKLLFITAIVFLAFQVNAQKKISELPAATSSDTADYFVIVQSGSTKSLKNKYLMDQVSDTANVLRNEFSEYDINKSEILYFNDDNYDQETNDAWQTLMQYTDDIGNIDLGTKNHIRVQGFITSTMYAGNVSYCRLQFKIGSTTIASIQGPAMGEQNYYIFEADIYFYDKCNVFMKLYDYYSDGTACNLYLKNDLRNTYDFSDPDTQIYINLDGYGDMTDDMTAEYLSVELITN